MVGNRTNEDEPTDPVETTSKGLMIMTMEEYLRSARTLTEAEAHHVDALHDADYDVTPQGHVSFDTGSFPRAER